MSSEPLALGQALLPKRNRAAYPQEAAILDEEQDINDKFIKSLQEELEKRIVRANAAAEEVITKAARRAEAELHRKVVAVHRDALFEAQNELSSSNSVTDPLLDQLRALGLDTQKPRYLGITSSSVTHTECEGLLTLEINKLNGNLRLAHDAVRRALEDQEVAIAHEERCRFVVQKIQKYISEMKEIVNPPLNRSIWRVPEDVWRQIFSDVTHNDVELEEVEYMYPSAPISFPSLTLSAVCNAWRTITHDHTLLWRTIHLNFGRISTSDALRARHYIEFGKNRPLRILVEVPPAASTGPRELDLMKQALSVPNQVDLLVVRGGQAGRAVVVALSRCLSPPVALTVAFTSHYSYQILEPNTPFSINLEQLKVKKCSPFAFLALHGQPYPSKIRRLEVRYSTVEKFRWSTFRVQIDSVFDKLQDLVYVGGFYSTDALDCGVGSTILTQLKSLTMELNMILIFHKSKIYTPALQSLTIVVLQSFDQHAEWKTYANDPRGGGNITSVAFEKNGPPDGPSHVMPIHQLPKLMKISLRSPHVEQILHGLNICAQYHPDRSERSGIRPLGALRVLSITDYDGDGQQLATFVRNYQQESGLEFDSTSAERNTVLKVELRNCPNISAEVLTELHEIGSIPVGQE